MLHMILLAQEWLLGLQGRLEMLQFKLENLLKRLEKGCNYLQIIVMPRLKNKTRENKNIKGT